LSHIDLAAAVEARETCGLHNFVTVAMDKVVFHAPVFVGDVVSFYTETVKVGRTSVTTRVTVEARRPENRETVKVTEAEVVFVAVDENRHPVPLNC
jgi:acyl-CoA thioesterase YciA